MMDDVAFVSAGVTHTIVLKTDGSLWGWGSGSSGELGDIVLE
jgi:alpha-tubulin suppressor-like RCC1 family protein